MKMPGLYGIRGPEAAAEGEFPWPYSKSRSTLTPARTCRRDLLQNMTIVITGGRVHLDSKKKRRFDEGSDW